MSNTDATTHATSDQVTDATGGTHDPAALAERIAAVERALAENGGGRTRESGPEDASLADRVDEATARLDDLGERVDELDAAVQALRGYAGGFRAVNEAVERRADLTLATARGASRAEAADDEGPAPEGGTPDRESAGSAGDADAVERAPPDQPAVAAAVPPTDDAGSSATPRTASNMPRDSGRDPEREAADGGVLDRLRDAL